jgi:hypothetical protein
VAKNWRGEPTMPQDDLNKLVKQVYDMNVPLTVHTNGDATIDMFLKAYEFARAGDFSRPWNVTTIHTQFMRKDHIERFVKYKIRPSFYTLHTFYFATAHKNNRGPEQAAYISPMRDAIDAGCTRRTTLTSTWHAQPNVHDVVGGEPHLARGRCARQCSVRESWVLDRPAPRTFASSCESDCASVKYASPLVADAVVARLRLIVGRRAHRLDLTCEPADELLLLENQESLPVILDLHGGYQLAIIDGTEAWQSRARRSVVETADSPDARWCEGDRRGEDRQAASNS